jgi:hypothetical protein
VKIEQGFPPNILEIKNKFPITVNTVYAYGETLYNPSGQEIPQDLMVHEETHQRQQQVLGVEQWWGMYLTQDGFRLRQEVEAYGEQYKFLKTVLNRKGRLGILQRLAQTLSSPLYGNIINKKEAQELIENYE